MSDYRINKEINNQHKGRIGEILVTHIGEFNEENYPGLYEMIQYYIDEYLRVDDSIDYHDEFKLFQHPSQDPGMFILNPLDHHQWGWTPDLIVTVRGRNQEDWSEMYNAAFPVEIKTGASSALRSNQREGVKNYTFNEEMPGFGLKMKVYLEDLPEKFGYLIQVPSTEGHFISNWRQALDNYSCKEKKAFNLTGRDSPSREDLYEEEYGYPEEYF